MVNEALPCGICIIPTVTPPVMSANRSFLMLYFGSQRRIGINRNRNRQHFCKEQEQEGIFVQTVWRQPLLSDFQLEELELP